MNTGNTKHTACIYARVSTAEQEKEGFSIPAQLKMLREYAGRHGFDVAIEFRDSETARSTGRTGFNNMLAYIDAHKCCRMILVEKTDRLTRNMTDYLALDIEKTGIEIHFVREGKVMSRDASPTAHFMQDVQISMAAYVSRNISAEAKKGMKAKAEAGLYPSVAPMGYKNIPNENGVKIIVQDPATAPLVRSMFEKYSTGNVSLSEIAKELFSLGMRTKKGNRIATSSIHKMLGNPIYRGKFLWNSIEYSGKHEPIVTTDLWFKVKDVRSGRSVRKPKQYHEFAYTGFMNCGICGCAITAERKKNKYSYYHCTGHKGWHHGEPSVREVKLDMQFSALLRKLQIDRDIANRILLALAEDTADERKTLEETRARLASQRNRLTNRSEVLYDDRLDGRINVTLFDRKSGQIRREIELIEEKLYSLESSSMHNPLSTARGILELVQSAPSLFLKGNSARKKQILHNLLSNCVLSHGTIKPEFRQPYELLYVTNAKWKASGAVTSDLCAVHSFWHPEQDSNSHTE